MKYRAQQIVKSAEEIERLARKLKGISEELQSLAARINSSPYDREALLLGYSVSDISQGILDALDD